MTRLSAIATAPDADADSERVLAGCQFADACKVRGCRASLAAAMAFHRAIAARMLEGVA